MTSPTDERPTDERSAGRPVPARRADDRPVLAARDVTVHFPTKGGAVHALDGVSLALHRGRTHAVVGESGSGKSTLARTLALVQQPTAGTVELHGAPVEAARRRRQRREFAATVQLVLQDPFSSLNPLHPVRYLLSRPLLLHRPKMPAEQLETEMLQLLERVALVPARRFLDARPHELSGGQRQRVAIARALAVRPDVILGDELISMLDVSLRLEVLNLLATLRDEEGLAMLYITHDIATARYFADEITVLYAGEVVETGSGEDVTQTPAHPYTRLLVESSPDPSPESLAAGPGGDGERPRADAVAAEPPDLISPPSGCRFHPRCPLARPRCAEASPPSVEVDDGHRARCWALTDDEQYQRGSAA
ncbi:ABC transporter ATP-binding protein [Desertihabitans aurantiacus]|uniref:ABC transporter ATP-binding protein n=1 Tax=Desertihabitans aurantiacus TaxID=2282477 RepID=UPI0018E532C1|nr:ABC transporter ATP-binding protein [Desertihabitans aurantiacus]